MFFSTDISQVDDTDVLTNYPYRDDALLIHKAIKKYVTEIVTFYYRKHSFFSHSYLAIDK